MNEDINEELETEKKYITIDAGEDFRTIAKIMSDNGFKMNHATARNQLMFSIKKLLTFVSNEINEQKLKKSNVKKMIQNQEIHESLTDNLFLAYEYMNKLEGNEQGDE